MPWTWEKGSNKERGEQVRASLPHCLGNKDELRKLFHLTEEGCGAILNGADWAPKYEDKIGGLPPIDETRHSKEIVRQLQRRAMELEADTGQARADKRSAEET